MLSPDGQLRIVVRSIDLSKANRDRAEAAYPYIGDWLAKPDSPLRMFSPYVFPQGSVALGTVNNPVGEVEFDVDAVLRLDLPRTVEAVDVRRWVFDRLGAHGGFVRRLEVLNRCIRIRYENGFHVDVVPARRLDGRLQIAAGASWETTNPLGFIQWFEQRSSFREIRAAKAFVEPLPNPVPTDDKEPLKLIVQLWKRARDIHFRPTDSAPASMLLTTLAANAYSGSTSLSSELRSALGEALNLRFGPDGPWVENPSNPGENLARGLGDRVSFESFRSFALWMNERLSEFLTAEGFDARHRALSDLFGDEAAGAASQAVAAVLNEKRASGNLFYSARAGLGSAVGSKVLSHEFHGEAE